MIILKNLLFVLTFFVAINDAYSAEIEITKNKKNLKLTWGKSVRSVPKDTVFRHLLWAMTVPGDFDLHVPTKIGLAKKIDELEERTNFMIKEKFFLNLLEYQKKIILNHRLGKTYAKDIQYLENLFKKRENLDTILSLSIKFSKKLLNYLYVEKEFSSFKLTEERYIEWNVLRSYFEGISPLKKFNVIEPGSFVMGSDLNDSQRLDDELPHRVTINQSFEIQETETTQLDWFLVMGYNNSFYHAQEHCPGDYIIKNKVEICTTSPVEGISWDEILVYIKRINSIDPKYLYSLPSEAQWEFAARGGTQFKFSFGNNEEELATYAWYKNNSGNWPQKIATKKKNGYGLYDMEGNVWEWTSDWYGQYQKEDQTNPRVLAKRQINAKVVRGGCWSREAEQLRVAIRGSVMPSFKKRGVGFRLVRQSR